MTHLYFIPVYILAYFTGARGMYSLLVHMDQPRLTKVVHSYYEDRGRPERDLDKSRSARVIMAFLWVPLIVATIAVLAGLGTYKYVTKPMMTPAEHAERKRRKRAEMERAVAQAERELNEAGVQNGGGMVPHHLVVDGIPQSDQPCHCPYCHGRVGVHGQEATELHRQRVKAHRYRDGR